MAGRPARHARWSRIVYLPASQLELVRQLEAQLLDLRLRLRPPATAADAILLVRIDDRSLAEIGRWPWSRATIAELVHRLQEAGAATIALDLLLAEPEPGALPLVELEGLAQALAAPDGEPARRLESARRRRSTTCSPRRAATPGSPAGSRRAAASVLPILFELAPGSAAAARRHRRRSSPAPRFAWSSRRPPTRWRRRPKAAVRCCRSRASARAAATLGHANVPLDPDGAARSELPAIAWGDAFYPSFALEAARLHLGIERDRVRLQLGPRHRARRALPADRREHAPAGQLSRRRALRRDLRGGPAARRRSLRRRSPAASC